jgi:DNA polymerase-1
MQQQEDGIFYPIFKQHATTSGRFGSDLQQLSRPMEEGSDDSRIIYFTNTLRALVIPKSGYAFIDDDYESLEPRVFADDAGDQALIDIFLKGEDFYSKVGIGAEKLEGVSADKKAANFLKNINPVARQNAKAYALGIRYGMKDVKLSYTLNISKEEAQTIIDNYFDSFPGLKQAMDSYLSEVKRNGTVTSKFGRVRHLPRAKEIYRKFGDSILDFKALPKLCFKHKLPMDELKIVRKEYNNLLNNALNFPIQSAAASLVNRAAIAMSREFLANGLDAWVSLQIHDQLVVSCHKDCIDKVKQVVQNCMENTNKLAMPLIAKPEIAYNLKDGH